LKTFVIILLPLLLSDISLFLAARREELTEGREELTEGREELAEGREVFLWVPEIRVLKLIEKICISYSSN